MSERHLLGIGDPDRERRLLLAVDDSDNSRRAVMYVADFFGGGGMELRATVLSILPEPSEDFFATDEERRRWLDEKRAALERTLADYKRILVGAGFPEDRVATVLSVRAVTSIGDAILEEQDALRCCIVVLGRRGISRQEEFIFGSTTARVLRNARRCAVMVVE